MPPGYLVAGSFLGRQLSPGVNPGMLAVLGAVEAALTAQFLALPPDQRINPVTGQVAGTVAEWAGLREAPGTWRKQANFHSSGSAIDLDTASNPYIATRTVSPAGIVFGGERPASAHPLSAVEVGQIRAAAVSAYDRAIQFMRSPLAAADVGNRRSGESTASCFDRFALVSELLTSYLSFGCASTLSRIDRVPVPNAESATPSALESALGAERRDKAAAVADLTSFMASTEFRLNHPLWPLTAEQQYHQILRDYELVRVPMVFGSLSLNPAATRNPVRGFLSLRRELVIALCDVGRLRWGACDMGAESGDMMHFDQNTHGISPLRHLMGEMSHVLGPIPTLATRTSRLTYADTVPL
ncbi:hypothetical protein [Actinocorallia sp. A-T 12471]|uniref:hypothetical protein n=1 Tax=Actinocorallia sp. A-T 12471 TaxID=3089813 RepID=UPI0029D0069C|nr:hypothetical protein [Actinocorallia sp. A-T 12471]MDX6740582.1 hypothetical protein [Actinocorallia sp. A-T 12471]